MSDACGANEESRDAVSRARMLLELDRDAEASALLGQVLAQSPQDYDALCLLAQACLGLGDSSGALSAATQAVRVAPDDEWPRRLRAIALARLGRPVEARAEADAAVSLDPDSWLTHLNRALVDLVAEQVTPMSVAAAQQAVRLGPYEAETHRALGAVLIATNRTKEAEAAVREALRLDPDDAAARNDLARLDLSRRRFGRAARGFADAVASDPRDDVAAHNLGVVAAKALRVVHLILWGTLIITFVLLGGLHHERTRAVIGFAVAGVSLGAFVAVLRRGAGPRFRSLVVVVLRRDRLLAVWLAFLAATFVLLGVAAWTAPHPDDLAPNLAFYSLLGGVGVGALRARRHR